MIRRSPDDPRVILDTLRGPFELRRPRFPGETPAIEYHAGDIIIEQCLDEVLTWQRMRVFDLLDRVGGFVSLTDSQALRRTILDSLSAGWLIVATIEGNGHKGDPGWDAVDAFRAAVGRTFRHGGAAYRLVFREDADLVRREGGYDAISAMHAQRIVAAAAKEAKLPGLVEVLVAHIVDLNTPSSQQGFVLLRKPIPVVRPQVATQPLTPSQLAPQATPRSHRLILEVAFADGTAVGNAAYELAGPGGPRQGRLDPKGSAVWSEVKRGAYTLTIPNLPKKEG